MCGFTGVFSKRHFKKEYKDFLKSKINNISEDLFHRGPDELGTFADDKYFMVHRRLSIIDLKNGNQPFFLNENEFIIYNGEIYNHIDLRKEIEKTGYVFKTDSDTEVLLAGVSIWKEHFLKKIDGMFAFVYVNKLEDEILASRDICGEKPLFYSFDKSNYYFSSELKPLKNVLNMNLSKKHLRKYFKYQYIPAPYTIYEEVFKILPGEFIKIHKNKLYKEKYFQIEKQIPNKKEEHNAKKLNQILKKSVKARLVSDVPVGAFLSGGIDSTIVVKNIRELLGGNKFHTFSIGFKEKYYDESYFSKKVSKKFNTIHHHFYFSLRDILENIHILKNLDEPFADSSSMAVYFLARKTAKYVKVVLSGDGADELFGGYYRYRMLFYSKIVKFIPKKIRFKIIELLRGYDNFYSRGIIKLLKISFEKKFYSTIMSNFNTKELNYLLKENNEEKFNFLEKSISEGSGSIPEKIMQCDFGNYLPDDILTKVDRMCMAGSIESRTPFLNKEVIRYAFSLKAKYRKGKTILKEILAKDFSKKFIHRKKRGFGIPLDKWFRGELGFYLKNKLSSDKEWTKFLNKEYVDKLLKDHMKNKKDNHYKLWQILVFIIWIEK